jgi:hypothetical protein
VRGVGEASKLSLLDPLLRLRGPNCLITDAAGFEASGRPCAPIYPCTPSVILSLPCSLHLEKRKRDEKGDSEKRNSKKYQDLIGVSLPSSLSHGRAGLDPFHHYAESATKTHEAWVYGGDRARGLSGAGGRCVPPTCGRIRGVLYDIL